MGISFAGTKLHEVLVERNKYVENEYNNYIVENSRNGKRNRGLEWLFLLRLNMAYLLLNRYSKEMNVLESEIVRASATIQIPPRNIGQVNKQTVVQANKANVSQVKLPYLDGAESELGRRPKEIHFAKDLLQYDVISFDIFDTLILRPFATPSDLFMVVGNKLNIIDFMRIRVEAEKKAREEAIVMKGTHEVTIYEIYEKVSRRTGLDVQKGVETEFETELEFCFANPYMKRVFEILQDQGKEIILTSDMYLPLDMMEKLLASCGYDGYSKLYVSCDYLCNKRNGGLYKNIRHEWGDKKAIVHVGDNYVTDIESAKKHGLDARYYKNCHEIGNPYRAEGRTELIGSLYAGIVNTHLHNGVKQYSPYYEYGFTYGGLYVTGYCNWIYQRAKEEGIDKILFLARDGAIYQKVFNMMFDDMPNEYVYWSRIANTKYAIENQRDDFLTRMVRHKALSVIPCTLADVLSSISLEQLESELKKHNLRRDEILTLENSKRFEDFFIANWKRIVDIYNEEAINVKKYLENIIRGCKKIAVVDVGWTGTGPLGIKYLIEQKWKMDCKVSCYIAASTHYNPSSNINQLMNNETQTYMFSRMYNRNLYDTHKNTNKGTNNIYFELFTQACSPSFAGITTDNKFMFDIPEVENYDIINEIHEGMYDFACRYIDTIKDNYYLKNISGYDAYLPYRFIIKNLRLIKKLFGGLAYSRGVGVSQKTQRQEKINDIQNCVRL